MKLTDSINVSGFIQNEINGVYNFEHDPLLTSIEGVRRIYDKNNQFKITLVLNEDGSLRAGLINDIQNDNMLCYIYITSKGWIGQDEQPVTTAKITSI